LVLEAVRQQLSHRNQIADFYLSIYQSPMDVLVKEFESKSSIALAEEYEKVYQNQLN